MRENDDIVHVRCVIKGEPARMILEPKRRGTVASVKEAVVQGICEHYDDLLRRGLRRLEA